MKSLFPRWLTTSIDLPEANMLPDLQLQKQLVSLQDTDTKNDVSHNCVKISQWLSMPQFLVSAVASCSKHGRPLVWPMSGWVQQLSQTRPSWTSLLLPLHPRGNKSSQSAETGFWGFAFMGGKIIHWLVIFLIAWVLYGFQSGIITRWSVNVDVEPLYCFNCLYLFPFTHTKLRFVAFSVYAG